MTKKTLTFLLVLFVSVGQIFSQIVDEKKLKTANFVEADSLSGWKTGGVANLSLTQIAFSNWATGGVNSVAFNGLVSLYANYRDTKNSWDNSLDLGYGILMQETYTKGYMKTDDRIDFTSKYGRKAYKNLFYTGLFNFNSQFAAGYKTPNSTTIISNFLAPGYMTAAIGLSYQPDNYLSVFFAPFSSKMTLVMNEDLSNQGAFGVDKGKSFRGEFGGYARISYQKDDFTHPLLKNVSVKSKLTLFSNYLKNPQNIDINWENLIAMKVNKYITVSLNTIMIYDDDIKILQDNGTKSAGLQFKEILGVGFSYTF